MQKVVNNWTTSRYFRLLGRSMRDQNITLDADNRNLDVSKAIARTNTLKLRGNYVARATARKSRIIMNIDCMALKFITKWGLHTWMVSARGVMTSFRAEILPLQTYDMDRIWEQTYGKTSNQVFRLIVTVGDIIGRIHCTLIGQLYLCFIECWTVDLSWEWDWESTRWLDIALWFVSVGHVTRVKRDLQSIWLGNTDHVLADSRLPPKLLRARIGRLGFAL